MNYKDSGVNIDAGNEAVRLMKQYVKSTYKKGVLGDLGGFGGLFKLDIKNYENPVLVSGTDGVGTKLKLAFMMDIHHTIGQDLVAMCVNDILVQGAKPLFFLDYLAIGKVDPQKVSQIVKGISKACIKADCSLIGGETAEMADFYHEDEYDLGGFAVGIVDEKNIITGKSIEAGDIILGLPSSGLHSNGYSLVRKVAFEHMKFTGHEQFEELGDKTLAEELLTPTKLYPKECLPLMDKFKIKGMVHITGGGFYENINRVLPQNTRAIIDKDSFFTPPIFNLLQKWGRVDIKEMYRVFNMGIGMCLITSREEAEKIVRLYKEEENIIYEIGYITEGNQDVIIKGSGFDG